MLNLELTGGQVLLFMTALASFTFLLIIGLKLLLNQAMLSDDSHKKTLRSRTKYPMADETKLTGILFRYGLLVAISFTFFAFSWSVHNELDYKTTWIEDYVDAEITPPITDFRPQRPLPPPPPQKIDPINDEILTDPTSFINEVLDPEPEIFPDKGAIPAPSYPIPPPPPKLQHKEKKEPVLIVAEQMPRFPGCEDMMASFKEKEACATKELLKYLYKNINYPNRAKENGIEGTAVVRFTVNKNGLIKDIKLLRDPGAGLGTEAIRVVNKMNEMKNNWTPGKQRGKPVSVLFTLPISFKLK